MIPLYKSKYDNNFRDYRNWDWTEEEVNKFLPLLEEMSTKDLLVLHEICEIKMFQKSEVVDKEQAIRVLINPQDTPKEVLFKAVEKIRRM